MKMRVMQIFVVGVALFCATATSARLYLWNNAKQPPVSLSAALAKAEELLGDDAKHRYCIGATLYSDEARQGEQGWWNLYYAAADGSQKQVVVDMQGEGHVTLANKPIDWKKHDGRRTGLADVRARLDDLFARQGIKAKFTVEADRLLVTHNVREFQIYPRRDDGSYADKLETVLGPEGDGIWLEARIVDKPDGRFYGYDEGVYWSWHRGTFLLTEPEKYLAMDLRSGPRLDAIDSSIVGEVMKTFGEPTPNDFDPFR